MTPFSFLPDTSLSKGAAKASSSCSSISPRTIAVDLLLVVISCRSSRVQNVRLMYKELGGYVGRARVSIKCPGCRVYIVTLSRAEGLPRGDVHLCRSRRERKKKETHAAARVFKVHTYTCIYTSCVYY